MTSLAGAALVRGMCLGESFGSIKLAWCDGRCFGGCENLLYWAPVAPWGRDVTSVVGAALVRGMGLGESLGSIKLAWHYGTCFGGRECPL